MVEAIVSRNTEDPEAIRNGRGRVEGGGSASLANFAATLPVEVDELASCRHALGSLQTATEAMLLDFGVSLHGYQAMLLLDRQTSETRWTAGALGKALGLNRHSGAGLLRRMEASGLLTRCQLNIELSEAGARLLREIAAADIAMLRLAARRELDGCSHSESAGPD